MGVAHQALFGLPPLAGLSDTDRSRLREAFIEKTVAGRTTLYREGDPPPGLHFLADGFVKLSRSSAAGRELLMSLSGPHDLFGPCCDPFTASPARCSATTQGPVRLLVMPAQAFRSLSLAAPAIAHPLSALLMQGRRGCTDLAAQMVFQSVEARLATLLVNLSRWSPATDGPTVLPPLLTQAEMACAVGSAREVVTRCLARFEDQGLIQRRGRRIVIPALAALAAVQE